MQVVSRGPNFPWVCRTNCEPMERGLQCPQHLFNVLEVSCSALHTILEKVSMYFCPGLGLRGGLAMKPNKYIPRCLGPSPHHGRCGAGTPLLHYPPSTIHHPPFHIHPSLQSCLTCSSSLLTVHACITTAENSPPPCFSGFEYINIFRASRARYILLWRCLIASGDCCQHAYIVVVASEIPTSTSATVLGLYTESLNSALCSKTKLTGLLRMIPPHNPPPSFVVWQSLTVVSSTREPNCA